MGGAEQQYFMVKLVLTRGLQNSRQQLFWCHDRMVMRMPKTLLAHVKDPKFRTPRLTSELVLCLA